MKKSVSDISFNQQIKACYNFWKSMSAETANIYGQFYNTLYNSDKNYIHKYPSSLILQLTSNCNLRCHHCFFSDKPEKYDIKNDLSDKEIFNLVKYFVEDLNILYCTITGGEIFTSPILLKIIKYLKKYSVVIKLVTNGTLITDENAKKISKLLNPKYDVVQVSLDGSTKEINDSIRGAGVYDKVISAIKSLTKYGCPVEIGFTVNSKNVDDIADMYKIAQVLKVKSLNVGKFTLECEEQQYLQPKTEDIVINISKLAQRYKNDVKLRLPCLQIPDFIQYEQGKKLIEPLLKTTSDNMDLHCRKHHEQVALFANGNISLCYDCSISNAVIGNIKTNSFEEIWANRFDFSLFQKRFLKNHKCKKCKYVSVCLSGCPYRAFKKYGTINAPGYDCKHFDGIGE